MQKEYRQKVRRLFCYSDNKILCCDSAFAVLDFDTDIILGSSAGSDLHGLSGAVCASLGVFGGGGLFVICRILIRRCTACCCACDGQCLAEGILVAEIVEVFFRAVVAAAVTLTVKSLLTTVPTLSLTLTRTL